MNTRQTRKIQSSLTSKGFITENTHHCCLVLQIGGRNSHIRTYYSHGAKECGDFHLKLMANQLCLTKQELFDLIDCQLGKEALIQTLRERGALRL